MQCSTMGCTAPTHDSSRCIIVFAILSPIAPWVYNLFTTRQSCALEAQLSHAQLNPAVVHDALHHMNAEQA